MYMIRGIYSLLLIIIILPTYRDYFYNLKLQKLIEFVFTDGLRWWYYYVKTNTFFLWILPNN